MTTTTPPIPESVYEAGVEQCDVRLAIMLAIAEYERTRIPAPCLACVQAVSRAESDLDVVRKKNLGLVTTKMQLQADLAAAQSLVEVQRVTIKSKCEQIKQMEDLFQRERGAAQTRQDAAESALTRAGFVRCDGEAGWTKPMTTREFMAKPMTTPPQPQVSPRDAAKAVLNDSGFVLRLQNSIADAIAAAIAAAAHGKGAG